MLRAQRTVGDMMAEAANLVNHFDLGLNRAEVGRQLAANEDVMEQVSLLKAKYLGYAFDSLDRWALCHGDLHPGGVMLQVRPPPLSMHLPPSLPSFAFSHLFSPSV